jgi:hypothetical protein
MLEYWSTGLLGFKYITPSLQLSNTPVSSSGNRL